MNNAYTRFLSESVGIQKPQDSTARELFELICLHESIGHPMTVGQSMHQPHIASPATLHRKLDDLLELGLINSEHQGENRRTKYLKLSAAGLMYTEMMSQAIGRSLK